MIKDQVSLNIAPISRQELRPTRWNRSLGAVEPRIVCTGPAVGPGVCKSHLLTGYLTVENAMSDLLTSWLSDLHATVLGPCNLSQNTLFGFTRTSSSLDLQKWLVPDEWSWTDRIQTGFQSLSLLLACNSAVIIWVEINYSRSVYLTIQQPKCW